MAYHIQTPFYMMQQNTIGGKQMPKLKAGVTHYTNHAGFTRKQYNNKLEKYLLNCINVLEYVKDDSKLTVKQELQTVFDVFVSEYFHAHNLQEYQHHSTSCFFFAEYLKCLPNIINIPFYYSDIIELFENLGRIPKNISETKRDKILNEYWYYIATWYFKLFKKYKVNMDIK